MGRTLESVASVDFSGRRLFCTYGTAFAEGLLERSPCQHRALYPLGEFANSAEEDGIAETFCICVGVGSDEKLEIAKQPFGFVPRLAFQFQGHQGSTRLANCAARSFEFD